MDLEQKAIDRLKAASDMSKCVEGETKQSCGLALGICSPCRRGGQA